MSGAKLTRLMKSRTSNNTQVIKSSNHNAYASVVGKAGAGEADAG